MIHFFTLLVRDCLVNCVNLTDILSCSLKVNSLSFNHQWAFKNLSVN